MSTDTIVDQGNVERYLQFHLGEELYALPLCLVKEVIALTDTTPIPNAPPHFLGIMNLRGQIISVMDLRVKLGMKPDQSPESTIVICDLKPLCIGMVVSSVDSVLSVGSKEIQTLPENNSFKNTKNIKGVIQQKDQLIVLLDIHKTLDVADHSTAKSTQPAAKAS